MPTLIAQFNKLTLDKVNIQNVDEAMKQMLFEVSFLGNLPKKLGKQGSSNPIEASLILKYLNNVVGEKGGLYRIAGDDPHVVWQMNPPLTGESLIYFDISIDVESMSELTGQIFWAGPTAAFSEEESYKFTITEDGRYVLPLGKYNQWIQGEEVHFVRFDIDGLHIGNKFKMDVRVTDAK